LRTAWLTAKIAAFVTVLLVFVLLATSHLFGKVVGRDVVQEIISARADAGTQVAEGLEQLLVDHDLYDDEVAEFLLERSRELDIEMALIAADGGCVTACRDGMPIGCGRRRMKAAHGEWRDEVRSRRGRSVRMDRRRPFELEVPIEIDGIEVATLAMNHPDQPLPDRGVFVTGLLRIGAAGLLAAIALAVYLTAPLRRMSRSMNRVADGDLDHRVVARGRDEVARMGQSFNTMANRIQTMINGQKELMAGVSHELRSPLSRMKLSLELLRAQGADSGRLDQMQGEIDELDGMVEELLVASRLDLGSESLDPRAVPLDSLLADAWNRVAASAAEAGMELDPDVGDGADAVTADPALAVRVLGNLFENAVRHGGAGPIRVRARRAGDRVQIRVADGGDGVDPDHLEHLFEPFYRADKSRSRKTGGTGLGLMIVRRAVEAHGGTVMAESTEAGGLAVVFDLPV